MSFWSGVVVGVAGMIGLSLVATICMVCYIVKPPAITGYDDGER